jgi:hypothetical protein
MSYSHSTYHSPGVITWNSIFTEFENHESENFLTGKSINIIAVMPTEELELFNCFIKITAT